MNTESEKLQIAIYKIDMGNESLSISESPISEIKKHVIVKGYELQEIENDSLDGYKIELLYRRNPFSPKWKEFLSSITKQDQNILIKNKSYAESFVMLILNTTSNNLYAITGGFGYNVIQDFIDDDFGVDVLSRLITKEDKILKSVKEKSVLGSILGSTKYFRNNYNLFENDSFGKIYQELKANLDKNILCDRFGFSLDDLKNNSNCIAKTSFRINKSVLIEDLLQIITGCEYVLDNLDPISINNVEKIVKKKNQGLVNTLENQLFNQLWERYSGENENIDFDLCHKDFEQYLTATYYIVKKNSSNNNFFGNKDFRECRLENIDELFKQIREMEGSPSLKDDFVSIVRSLKIYSYNDENQNNPLTKGWLLHHIFGEVSLEDKKYFLIDNNWYRIKNDFVVELNDSCEQFIKNNYDDGLDKKWDFPTITENQYNEKYISEKSTIVLDRVTPENIEPCDILRWDEKNLYFYHVKSRFGNTMRDLCSQIFIAANKIQKDVKSTKEYTGQIYDHLQNMINSKSEYSDKVGKQTESITKEDFVKLFVGKNLIFVLSVLDTAENERDLRNDISDFSSNIAKFSLQELVKGMKGIDVEFRIQQIFKQ